MMKFNPPQAEGNFDLPFILCGADMRQEHVEIVGRDCVIGTLARISWIISALVKVNKVPFSPRDEITREMLVYGESTGVRLINERN